MRGAHAAAVPNVGTVVHLVRADPPPWPPVLIIGGCGGGGATTTTLGLASQIADLVRSVAVDGTASGGDLALRGADLRFAGSTLQSWLSAASIPAGAALGSSLSLASSGAAIVRRDASALPRRETIATVCDRLLAEGLVPIVDGGASAAARDLRPLLDYPDVRVAVTIPARMDAANRVAITLRQLDEEFGESLIASTVLVVSHQSSHTPPVAAALAQHYGGWVSGVIEVAFDPHLAIGRTITNSALLAETRWAYLDLARWLLPELGLPGEGMSSHG
ncbi:hypothetical protein [Nocardia sp. XZ_19_231]|uniref:hypothetical protein n=1 Tax=Nocardia sp. XZ_19_231 TaxID=2769252 RepID=UPI00188F9C30|nr:hypothetical protein [Nocardia sp. XZ_19_231]